MDVTSIVIAAVVIALALLLYYRGGSRGDTRVVLGSDTARPDSPPGRESTEELTRDVQALLESGRKIEAIRLLKERSGMPLEAAKTVVESLEKVGSLGSVTLSVATNTVTLSAEDTAEAQRLIRQGEKIEAIKLIRTRTGLGLKEAKDVADRLG